MKAFVESKTSDVRLFASVTAMGIPWDEESGSVHGGDRVWLLGEVSDCGKWKLKELLAWWHDAKFHIKNPKHPFHVVKSVMASDMSIRKALKSGQGITQEARGDSFIVSPSPEDKKGKGHATMDVSFAAAASGVGFKVQGGESVGRRRALVLSDASSTYGYTWAQIDAWWKDKTFEQNNGQHPFAYAKAAAINYTSSIKAIHSERPLVRWQPKGSIGICFIHPDCSSETEARFARALSGE